MYNNVHRVKLIKDKLMSDYQFRADLLSKELSDKVQSIRDCGYNTSELVRKLFNDFKLPGQAKKSA